MLIESLSRHEILRKLWTISAGHKLYSVDVCFCVAISQLQNNTRSVKNKAVFNPTAVVYAIFEHPSLIVYTKSEKAYTILSNVHVY